MQKQHKHPPPAKQAAPADEDSFSPQGTLLFVLVMLLGYGIYWAYMWIMVVIERGGA
jgi:hypothetical protein